jgi:predicted esterase
MAHRLCLHDLGSGHAAGLPDALIVILFAARDGAAEPLGFARHWQPTVPQAAFVGVELDAAAPRTGLAALRRAAAEAARARSIHPSQIILFGTGAAGRLAVDGVLQQTIPAAGVIGLDIPLASAPSHLRPTATMVRLVQHTADDDPQATRVHALIAAMQRNGIDVRSMILPHGAPGSPSVVMRAGGTFLVELVAKASRISAKRGSWL